MDLLELRLYRGGEGAPADLPHLLASAGVFQAISGTGLIFYPCHRKRSISRLRLDAFSSHLSEFFLLPLARFACLRQAGCDMILLPEEDRDEKRKGKKE